MTSLDVDCVVRWKIRTAEIRGRIAELLARGELTDEERRELAELKRESSKNVVQFLIGRYDAP